MFCVAGTAEVALGLAELVGDTVWKTVVVRLGSAEVAGVEAGGVAEGVATGVWLEVVAEVEMVLDEEVVEADVELLIRFDVSSARLPHFHLLQTYADEGAEELAELDVLVFG